MPTFYNTVRGKTAWLTSVNMKDYNIIWQQYYAHFPTLHLPAKCNAKQVNFNQSFTQLSKYQ